MCLDFYSRIHHSRVSVLAHIPPFWTQPYPFWTDAIDLQSSIPVLKACAFRVPVPHLWGRRNEQDISLHPRVSGAIISLLSQSYTDSEDIACHKPALGVHSDRGDWHPHGCNLPNGYCQSQNIQTTTMGRAHLLTFPPAPCWLHPRASTNQSCSS